MRRRSFGDLIFDIANTIFMTILVLVMAYPFLYLLSYSLSEPGKLTGGLLFFPQGFTLDSYTTVFKNPALLHSVFVSVMRTVLGPLFMVLVSSMAAFVLTRNELVGIKFMRKFFVFTMYISAGLIPLYLVINKVGLMGSFLVYIIPTVVSVFNMILIKTFIESLPKSLEESAQIDGANHFVLYWRVLFPLCKPVIAATVLFTAVEQWNMFFDTQIYNAMNPENHTLQYLLYQTITGATSLEQVKAENAVSVTPQSVKTAITLITVIPIALVYPFLQKHFAKGLLIGSIKE